MNCLDYYWLDSEPEDGKRHFIYALIDPRTSKVRYIGSSVNVAKRLGQHIAKPCNLNLAAWLNELSAVGALPQVVTLADCYGYRVSRRLEAVYIDEYQRLQGGLLNQEFSLASDRKRRFDMDARYWLRDVLRNARQETGFWRHVAKKRKPRGTHGYSRRHAFEC